MKKLGIDARLLDLIKLRASQINGCAYCVDMHASELRKTGETARRIDTLSVWRDTPFFTDRERAALAWTEAITRISETRAPDEDYELLKREFNEREKGGSHGRHRRDQLLEPRQRRVPQYANRLKETAMNMQNSSNRLVAALLASSALLLAIPAHADNGKDGKEAVIVLQKRTLPDAPGKKVMVVIVNYAPGQASYGHATPDRWLPTCSKARWSPRSKGEEPVTYKTGDSWYESPGIPHVVSRNASHTEPARLLVWMLSNEEEGIKVPVDK